MHSDDFIDFISQNWVHFGECELSEPLLLFFFFKNLYHRIFPHLNEFSIVPDATFDSAVSCHNYQVQDTVDDAGLLSCTLFHPHNFLLDETQKELLRTLLQLETPKHRKKSYFNFLKVYYSPESDGRSYILVSESALYEIVNAFKHLFANERDKNKTHKELAASRCKEYTQWIKSNAASFDLKSAIETEARTSGSSRILKLALGFFLLFVNPSFSGISKRMLALINTKNKLTLFNCTLIVNILISLHPKESDIWDIKAALTDRWFRTFRVRVRRVALTHRGGFALRRQSSSAFYCYLLETISRLFTDRLIADDQVFVPRILALKPFNNCVSNYLRHQYSSVCKYVRRFYSYETKHLEVADYSTTFREFTYLATATRYRILLSNALYRFFSEFYTRLLRSFAFPGLFLLLKNIITGRDYSSVPSSVISYRDLHATCFTYADVDRDFGAALELCDKMIKRDSENCWVDNKSKLLHPLTDLVRLLRPFHFNIELYGLIFRFRVLVILNAHLATWAAFTSFSALCTAAHERKRRRPLRPYKQKARFLGVQPDEYKSESTLIKREVQGKFTDGASTGEFVRPVWVYLEALEMFRRFNLLQVDHILSSFGQLLTLLFHLFRNISKLRRSGFDIDLGPFRELVDTVKTARTYAKVVVGDRIWEPSLSGIGAAKRMNKRCRLLFYRYRALLGGGREADSLEAAFARVALLLLSPPFRFYVHWTLASGPRLELLHRQASKLK